MTSLSSAIIRALDIPFESPAYQSDFDFTAADPFTALSGGWDSASYMSFDSPNYATGGSWLDANPSHSAFNPTSATQVATQDLSDINLSAYHPNPSLFIKTGGEVAPPTTVWTSPDLVSEANKWGIGGGQRTPPSPCAAAVEPEDTVCITSKKYSDIEKRAGTANFSASKFYSYVIAEKSQSASTPPRFLVFDLPVSTMGSDMRSIFNAAEAGGFDQDKPYNDYYQIGPDTPMGHIEFRRRQ